MTHIEITPSTLTVRITGMDRLWALSSHIDIPLEDVVGAAEATGEATAWLHETHIVGTHARLMLSAGVQRHNGELVFWDVHDPANAVAIELRNNRLARLVVEVENPAATLAEINQAIRVPVAAR